MNENSKEPQMSLEAKSPFELRVDLGRHVPETDFRTALATGEMGFVHSFTTGSTVEVPAGISAKIGAAPPVLKPMLRSST